MSEIYYVLRADNCRFESMTKEQILAAITQAVESHTISDVDTGFVTTIKDQNHATGIKLWYGTTAEYNALETREENTIYYKTDDTTIADLNAAITALTERLDKMPTIPSKELFWQGSIDITEGTSLYDIINPSALEGYNSFEFILTTSDGKHCTVHYDFEDFGEQKIIGVDLDPNVDKAYIITFQIDLIHGNTDTDEGYFKATVYKSAFDGTLVSNYSASLTEIYKCIG